jgi:3-oxoacyl-[acyl-carrier-protein] synthase III
VIPSATDPTTPHLTRGDRVRSTIPGLARPFSDSEISAFLGRETTYSRIAGVGSFVPEKRLANEHFESMLRMTDADIFSRTGISERRIADPGDAASDLASRASVEALHSAGVRPEEIDLIIVATVTPDTLMPSTACWLQASLGCGSAMAFDINAACSGFVYALSVADNMIRAGAARCALVVGVDVFSRIMDYQDRSTCILFGDGAGAVVLRATGGELRILSTHLFADGGSASRIEVPAGGSRIPASHQSIDQRLHSMVMRKGTEVFRSAVEKMSEAVLQALDHNGSTAEEIDLVIPHQANIRIIEAVADRLRMPREKFFTNLDRYGNTSAASVPLALDEAVAAGRVEQGDLIMLAAFGAGYTWGSALVRWG